MFTHVKMLKTERGAQDGSVTETFEEGQSYCMTDSLASVFIEIEAAEEITEEEFKADQLPRPADVVETTADVGDESEPLHPAAAEVVPIYTTRHLGGGNWRIIKDDVDLEDIGTFRKKDLDAAIERLQAEDAEAKEETTEEE